jgi:hypothetical protein
MLTRTADVLCRRVAVSPWLCPRHQIPELVRTRDRLRDQLADMSSTGRGFSQSECYRTLVQVEGLVNDGHHSSGSRRFWTARAATC